MIPVRDLGHPAVALEWHEAVAVVGALTATLWNARAAQAPTLDAAVLTPDGEVEVVGDGRLAGAVTSGLALALGALLESTPCPAELRHIVTANVGPAPEIDSVNAFARALLFFERPGRSDVLREVAARAAEALERVRADEELERLTERARHRAHQPPVVITESAIPAAAGSTRRLLAPAALALTVFIAVALAAATIFTTAPSPPERTVQTGPVEDDEAAIEAGPAATVPPEATPGGDPAGKAGGRPGGNPGAEAPGPRAGAAALGARPGAAASGTGAGTAAAAHAAATGAAKPASGESPAATGARGSDIVVKVTELGGAAVPGSGSAGRRGSSRVYTTGDSGVSPPVLVKPHLPAEPPADVPPWEVGTLELTVDTAGKVEQVHLISPYNRYQERMLVAAAKAWLFQPATKDGRPVRFRTRIRVTI